ncbi:30S ribosomal protein S5 [Candidatus Uhrbacteria bacterium]|nr:30S ribosomal protein S5 [Candidatus Uhrbacteria bacterium]
MAEENKRKGKASAPAGSAGQSGSPERADFGRGNRGDRRGGGGRGRDRRPEREPQEFDQQILDIARVTRVTKGGKRMRFRITMIIGDRKGRVGYGVAKGIDVQSSIQKAVTQAKKRLITVPLQNQTIPHAIESKFASARILLKPAPRGTGIKAGGAVRVVLEFAGVPNVTGKILGSPSKLNNTKAAFQALKRLMPPIVRKAAPAAEGEGAAEKLPVNTDEGK